MFNARFTGLLCEFVRISPILLLSGGCYIYRMVPCKKVLLGVFMIAHIVNAQGVFTNETTTALQKVIQDYPNGFRNITGAMLSSNPEGIDYLSTVEVPGGQNATVSTYTGSNKYLYSWKCTLFTGEEFSEASLKYQELFSHIRNSIIKVEGGKPFILTGKLEFPSSSKKNTTSIFQPFSAGGYMSQLKVQLTLQHVVTEWIIILSVYDTDATSTEGSLVR